MLLAAAAAAGCGFTPALAPSGPAAGLRGEIEYAAPNTRSGFFLSRQLETRLGLPATPVYRLQLAITEGTQVTSIPADNVTARRIFIGEVEYTLVHIPTGDIVRRGEVQSLTGVSTTSTTAATRTAYADATERLMTILADRVVADLLATSDAWRR